VSEIILILVVAQETFLIKVEKVVLLNIFISQYLCHHDAFFLVFFDE